jgi:DNA-binding MarR family transcriptional regulator
MDAALTAYFALSALLDPVRLRLWDTENLTVTQLRLLGHLFEQEGLSNADLADRLYVTRPSVSALLDRLERGGFIRREISQNDRRGINIWLEPRGREVVANVREDIRQYCAHLLSGLTSDQLVEFAEIAGRVAEAGGARRRKDLSADDADA